MNKENFFCVLASTIGLFFIACLCFWGMSMENGIASDDFYLLVVFVSLILLLIAVIGFIGMFGQSRMKIRKADNEHLKSELAEAKMAEKRLGTKLKAAESLNKLYGVKRGRCEAFYDYVVLPWVKQQVEEGSVQNKSFFEWEKEFDEFNGLFQEKTEGNEE